jgi:hypothetical protein
VGEATAVPLLISCYALPTKRSKIVGTLKDHSLASLYFERHLRSHSGLLAAFGGAMSNVNGKVYAMNVITPMRTWKTPILRLLFFVLWHVKPLQQDLINLSFIEFARWVVIPRDRFPFLGNGQERDELKYDYLLFFSNFNGTWNQYIDAFSAVLSRGLNLIWRWSEKFPGSQPVTLFKEYIARVQFDTDYYYTAYPNATANDLKSAHVVQSAFDALHERAQASSPEEFAEAYREFVLKVQMHLGETGEAPVAC